MQKRVNPFATPIVKNEEPKEEKVVTKPVYEEPEYVEEPVYVAPKQERVVRRQPQSQPKKIEKVKFTSVMDPDIRRKVKIACATRGILFAQYLEDACREKLRREGDL
ncbi:MAG: hypothetical protein IJX78_02300 [Bacilli bacterium]|nr:hypothetical protein [Bacilli bacterium]